MGDFFGSVRKSPYSNPEESSMVSSSIGNLTENIGSCLAKSKAGFGLGFSSFKIQSPPTITEEEKEEETCPIRWQKGIGCGAFGHVYMRMNLDSGELLTVKQVMIGVSSASKEKAQAHVRELEEEVKLLKNLSHANIVDFKMFYNSRFESDNNTVHANGHVNNTPELADFEQFERQALSAVAHGTLQRPQKPLLPEFDSAETRTLAETLCRDNIRGSPGVKWVDIKGLESAKRLLKEAVVMPIKYPKYFKGLLSPWKGILLFGPPGTGKTMLAEAVATECNTTFFNISASSFVSKRRGDSEKLVKVLFELARRRAPSTIFLDQIDAIISQRGEACGEHEASRRLKTELLIQMDRLAKTDELVFVLAATNLPWELDTAMLRRLEKRILVPLPKAEARQAMFEELLPAVPGQDVFPYNYLAENTEGYSGSDIRLVCKESAMQPLRRLMTSLESQEKDIADDELPPVDPVTTKDIENALKNTRPSAHLHAYRYEKFNDDYGSQMLH